MIAVVFGLFGWAGLALMTVATGIGLIPVYYHSRRMNCMGVLLVPITLNMAGLGPHIATMLFAIVVLHVVSRVQRNRRPEERTYAPDLISSIVALALVWVGIAALGKPLIG